MTKKIFAQPEMMVVSIKKHDIVTDSVSLGQISSGSFDADAPGRRDAWDAGF